MRFGRGSFWNGVLFALICALVFWAARSGAFNTKACDMCGKVVQDYVEVKATPKSANILNIGILKDASKKETAQVSYDLCNDCFDILNGAIIWQRKQNINKGGG